MRERRQNGCARCCIKCVQWLPVLFIALIVAWSYYAYVYSLCIVTFLVLYHIFLILFTWSYAKCILEEPKSPPNEFSFTGEDWKLLQNMPTGDRDKNSILLDIVGKRNLPVYMVGNDGNINVCLTCGLIKPDRAHHCSTCGKPRSYSERLLLSLIVGVFSKWIITVHGQTIVSDFTTTSILSCSSVGAPFIVSTLWPVRDPTLRTFGRQHYSSFPNTFVTFTCFFYQSRNLDRVRTKQFFGDLSANRFQVMFLFIVAAMFGICQTGLGGYHVYLAARNQTTLETYAIPKFRNGSSDARAFDMGRRANLQEMFGTNCCLAILPVRTTLGDGVHWRYRSGQGDLALLESGGNLSPIPLTNSF
ncbi:Palmitoyltransferase [Fasciolopsis buskii]|uniref:Palmitoyltransferase n=1 Tax=Fasciolopsis buskii TaxID=27845 RepID=A0A8E0VIR6_9TREM|nr:Palmitoyltransferase [Fasciolopsis buski]